MADRDSPFSCDASSLDEIENTTVEPLPAAVPAPPRPAPPRAPPRLPPPRAPAVSEPTLVGELEPPLDTAVHRMPEPSVADTAVTPLAPGAAPEPDLDAEDAQVEELTGTVPGRAAQLIAVPELPPRAAAPSASDARRSRPSASDAWRFRTSASDDELPLPIPYEPFGIPGLGDDGAARRWLIRFALVLTVVVVVLLVRLVAGGSSRRGNAPADDASAETAGPGPRSARSASDLPVAFDRPPEPPAPPSAAPPPSHTAPATVEDDPLGEPPSRFSGGASAPSRNARPSRPRR